MKPNDIVKECEINLNRKFTRKENKYILKWIKEYEFDFKTISLVFIILPIKRILILISK